MARDFLVVVESPGHSPRVVTICGVASPERAAAGADVPPGGHCIVVMAARRFDRAAQAPLEERELSGESLPVAGPS